MSAHTPGSWRVEQDTTVIWGACDAADNSSRGMGYPIAECRTFPAGLWATGPYSDEAEANAKLIAAAPDLLEALKNLVDRIEYYSSLRGMDRPNIEDWEYTEGSGDMAKARAAIEKATQP